MKKDSAFRSYVGKIGGGIARGAVTATLVASLIPTGALAAPADTTTTAADASYDLTQIADGTYEGTATVTDTDEAATDEYEAYDLTASVTVADHKITNVDVKYETDDDDSYERTDRAISGYHNRRTGQDYASVTSQIVDKNSTDGIDLVSTATVSSKAIVEAVNNALASATTPADTYVYGYSGLTWAEYYAAEPVDNATNDEPNATLDSHGESDLGGFDVVTRATTNHGLHRGSFQTTAVIETESGKFYTVNSWKSDGSAFYEPDGTEHSYARGTIDGTETLKDYKVYGLKYVPVAVKASELDAYKASGHTFIENGSTLSGGYSENSIQAYSETSNVDENTNGLKVATVTTAEDGTTSVSYFAAKRDGTTSGIEGQELKTIDLASLNPNLRSGDDVGSYGETIRIDLAGEGYGDLGANLQSVTWEYYGDTDPSANPDATPEATYGTKFAADNWMHRKLGVQLGLSDSYRSPISTLSNGGAGYWKITTHALGYADASYTFQVTSDNIAVHTLASDETKAQLQALVDQAKALDESSYTADSWSTLQTELTETEDLLGKTTLYESEASEQVTHLQSAIDGLVRQLKVGDYVLMNIPYSEYYAAETGSNTTKVDVFTSATKSKTTGNLSAGTYHNEDGSEITGITYAVKVADENAVKALADATVVDSSDALRTAASYSYAYLSDDPTSYKEVTADADGNLSFSKVSDESGATELDGTGATVSTESSYGDYEIDFKPGTTVFDTLQNATVKGAVIQTSDGTGYGLRSLENIWKTGRHGLEFAWCTGFTSTVHGCPTSSAHYESIMGKTITGITVFTDSGTYQINTGDLYVPLKSSEQTIAAEDTPIAESGDTTVKVTTNLSAFTDPTYTLNGQAVTVTDGTISVPAGSLPGSYLFIAKDSAGVYADVETEFVLSTDKTVAAYDAENNKLVKADDASDEDFSNYVNNITSVSVNGKAYNTGHHGTTIVKSNGSIDLDVTNRDAKVFDGAGTYQLEVTSTGYSTPLTFDVVVPEASVAVYRLYNPYDYLRLYTTDKDEYDSLVELGWNGEGVAWQSPTTGTPVYRLYNQWNGEHLYTTDKAEYDNLVGLGWSGEDVKFYSGDAETGVAVRRFYNPWIKGTGSTHHFTTDEAEAAEMVAAGWQDENIAFYGVKQD